MVALDDFPQLPPVHVGVDLGGADVGVAEKFLNHPEVGATDQKVGGETVPELVGMHILEPGDLGILPHDLPDRDPFERAAAEGQKQSLKITAIIETDEMRSEFGQILSAITTPALTPSKIFTRNSRLPRLFDTTIQSSCSTPSDFASKGLIIRVGYFSRFCDVVVSVNEEFKKCLAGAVTSRKGNDKFDSSITSQ